MKPSQLTRYKRTVGIFCSAACSASAKSICYSGNKNPNYKGKNTDSDGYRLYAPQASSLQFKSMKMHQAVCCEVLGINRIPHGLHVHHRDCDILNNDPINLAVMTASDHKWLHKQFGVAPLWAHFHKKIDTKTMILWSDDRERAEKLLNLHVALQVGNMPIV